MCLEIVLMYIVHMSVYLYIIQLYILKNQESLIHPFYTSLIEMFYLSLVYFSDILFQKRRIQEWKRDSETS